MKFSLAGKWIAMAFLSFALLVSMPGVSSAGGTGGGQGQGGGQPQPTSDNSNGNGYGNQSNDAD